MHERRRALAKPMPACFATLLRPGTGALRRSGETFAPGEENFRYRNHFGMDDRDKRRLNLAVIDINQFKNLRLQGGFIITDIELRDDPIVDAIGREAIAQTQTIAGRFRLFIRSGLSEEELSITLYHEVLEAASVATSNPPASVMDFKEADFERAAHDAQKRWGNASPANLDLLLQFHGFRRQ